MAPVYIIQMLITLVIYLVIPGIYIWAIVAMGKAGRTGPWWTMLGGVAGFCILEIFMMGLAFFATRNLYRGDPENRLELLANLMMYGSETCFLLFAFGFAKYSRRLSSLGDTAADLEMRCQAMAQKLGSASSSPQAPYLPR